MNVQRFQFLDGFSLKILALVLMFLDHLGAFMTMYLTPVEGTPLFIAVTVFRAVGRLAFPLFAFFVAEGMRKTHDRGNYLLRFAILFAIVLIAQAGLSAIPSFASVSTLAQPFGDLLSFAAIAYLYEKGGNWRFLIALPVLYLLGSGVINILNNNGVQTYVPLYLLAQYNIVGLVLFVPLYFLPKVMEGKLIGAGLLIKDGKEISFPRPDSYGEAAYRRHMNALNASIVAAVFAIFWIVSYLTPYLGFYFEPLGQTGISFEMYGIIAAFFLLLYNGRRGYHAKWWVYFEWSFFPVHILLLAGIFALISL